MAMTLFGFGLVSVGQEVSDQSFIGRICEREDVPWEHRCQEILRVRSCGTEAPPGFLAYLFDECPANPPERNAFVLAPGFGYLREGDIVRIDASTGAISTVYRTASLSNSLLVTERCNNRCLMCSQPPTERTDAWLFDEVKQVIPLISPDTREIGVTGGEPGLLGPRLIELLELLQTHLPCTAVHILSNGRPFSDRALAMALAQVRHPDVMVGVPIHSDLPEEHDYIAQAHGAFDEAVRGILNLKQAGVRVEIRFVMHAQSSARLVDFAEFVARNLLFVDQVALMGMEIEGYARENLDVLWIDPHDYHTELIRAVRRLVRAGSRVSIYNLPLCVLSGELHPFARQSISDWKTVFLGECTECNRREVCCGFFASGTSAKSRGIKARRPTQP
jgi:His-Xaa-Ser system radical SAM maturase HxsC